MAHIKKSEVYLMLVLIGLVVLTRTVLHIGENIEFVTAAAITAGYFLQQKRLALWVTLVSLIVSDTLIGNTTIFLFTWSGFMVAPVLGAVLSKLKFSKTGAKARTRQGTDFNQRFSVLYTLVSAEALGIISTLVFFLWTNFGVVLTTNMYAKTVEGLVQSYINALPFLRNQLIGNLIFVPVILTAVLIVKNTYLTNKIDTASQE